MCDPVANRRPAVLENRQRASVALLARGQPQRSRPSTVPPKKQIMTFGGKV
jgi:hypothetical protein